MSNLQLKQVPITKTGMLIRKPAADVFEAFVNPDITTKFWFTKSSGRLEAGKQVQWDWEKYGISIPVTAKAIGGSKNTNLGILGAALSGTPSARSWHDQPNSSFRLVAPDAAYGRSWGRPIVPLV